MKNKSLYKHYGYKSLVVDKATFKSLKRIKKDLHCKTIGEVIEHFVNEYYGINDFVDTLGHTLERDL